jgi:hypothetical protein
MEINRRHYFRSGPRIIVKITNKIQLYRLIYYSKYLPKLLPAATWVNNTRYCKYSKVLLMMGENIARNMYSWLGIIIDLYSCILLVVFTITNTTTHLIQYMLIHKKNKLCQYPKVPHNLLQVPLIEEWLQMTTKSKKQLQNTWFLIWNFNTVNLLSKTPRLCAHLMTID